MSDPIGVGTRKHFEDLLTQMMKADCRRQRTPNEKAAPEFYGTYRLGFKAALQAFQLINESTTELNDKQMKILCDRLENLLGMRPPPPDAP